MITNARITFEVFRQILEPVSVPETSPPVLGVGNPAPGVVFDDIDVPFWMLQFDQNIVILRQSLLSFLNISLFTLFFCVVKYSID